MKARDLFVAPFGHSKLLLGLGAALLVTLVLGSSLASAIAPSVTIDPASEVGITSVEASGEVNPEGKETSYYFQHATQAQFDNAEWEGFDGFETLPEGAPAKAVSTPIGGLAPATVYHLRLVASNEDGEDEAVLGETFETDPAKEPLLTIAAPTDPRYTTAHLSGTIDPQGGNKNPLDPDAMPIVWALQFSPENETGEFLEWQSVPEAEGTLEGANAEASGPVEVKGDLPSGTLKPGSKYQVRLFAYYLNYGREATSAEPNPEFETEAVAKPIVDFGAAGITGVTDAAAHFKGVVNPNAPEAAPVADPKVEEAFKTTYAFSCFPKCPGLEGPRTLVAGNAPVDVEDATAGLLPSETYAVTLSATNAGGTTEATRSFETATVLAPTAETNPTHGLVTDTTARLLGTLETTNSNTTYRFEYGTTSAYGQSSADAATGPASGLEPRIVGQDIEGLQPETTYHFRIVAENSVGSDEGEDQTFTTDPVPAPKEPCPNEAIRVEQDATRLPDCMAYELVSPADTAGFDNAAGVGGTDGNHAWMGGLWPLLPDGFTGNGGKISLSRTPSGWTHRELAPSDHTDENSSLMYVAADSETALVKKCKVSVSGCINSTPATFERVDPDGARRVMANIPARDAGPPIAIGASDDATRMVFFTPVTFGTLLPEDTHTKGRGLYASDDGNVEFLGYDENEQVLDCGATLVVNDELGSFMQDGISADGRDIVFESPDPEELGKGGCPAVVDLYLRHDGESIDISAPTNGNPNLGARFVGASQDGNLTFFVTASQLLSSDTDSYRDVYRYDLKAEALSRVTEGEDVGGAEFGVVIAPNAQFVYFVSKARFSGAGREGAPNLYVAHNGDIRYIATALGDPGFVTRIGQGIGSDGLAPPTPDGRHLLFTSTADLTGQPSGGHLQIFSYDWSDSELSCVSCHPDGTQPTEDTRISTITTGANVDPRLQSDDGSTVAFQSFQSLLPMDTNGKRDVYRWKEGTLSLISRGGQTPSGIRGQDTSGHSVFFNSVDRLTADAVQDNQKLFVARVNGGFAKPATPTPCAGEGCRGAGPAAGPGASPTTPSFSGPANRKPKRGQGKRQRKKHHAKHKSRQHKRVAKHEGRSGR